MNREVMSRQMFRNGGVVYMAEGGSPQVVETFSAIFSTGDADKILDYFISHERELRRAAASNEKLGTMIQFIESMEARRADETIAETQRLSEMPQTDMIEVAAPGGSAYMKYRLPFGGETPQPPMSPKTYFDEYRGSEQRPLTDESDEVTKDMLKRRRKIFQSDYFPLPRPLDETEINNAYSMMLSDKGFTDEEIRKLATNPSGRMLDYTRRQAEYDFSKDPIGIQDFAEGGMAMPAPMPAAPGPEGIASLPNKAAMEAMPTEGVANEASRVGLDPAVVQQMLGEVDTTLGDLENAESYEDVINGIREADAPIEARYKELAGFVGEEDAMRTPESVLTMLQPVIMMAGVDQGIGALASEEMTAPVTGDMAGGIMSTVNMGEEGVPPVNFNQGGAVQYFAPANENRVAGAMPGGRLGELFGEKKDVYRTIMGGGAQEEEYQKQKDLTEAQMLFDIAQGALGFAAGSGMPGRSPAEQLAAAASPVLGNISQRAGELAKFKQAQAKEARSMDLAALTAAEGALTAEKAAESALELAKAKKKDDVDNVIMRNPNTGKVVIVNRKSRTAMQNAVDLGFTTQGSADKKGVLTLYEPNGNGGFVVDLNTEIGVENYNKYINLGYLTKAPSEKGKGTSYLVTIDGVPEPGLFDQEAVNKLIKDNPGKSVEANTVPTLPGGLESSAYRLLTNPQALNALRNNTMSEPQKIAILSAISKYTQEQPMRTGTAEDGQPLFTLYKPTLPKPAAEAYKSYLKLVGQSKNETPSLNMGIDDEDRSATPDVPPKTVSQASGEPGPENIVTKQFITPGGGTLTQVVELNKSKLNMDAFLDEALEAVNPDVKNRIASLPEDFNMRSSYGLLGQFKELTQTPFDIGFGVSLFPLTNESQNVISELNNTMELVFSSETGLRDSVARMSAMRNLLPDPSTAWRPRGPNNAASKIRALLPKINDSIRDMSEVLKSGNVPESKRGEVMLNLKRLIVMNKAYSDFKDRLSSAQDGATGSKIQQDRIYKRAKEAEERKRLQIQGSQ